MAATDLSDLVRLMRFTGHYCNFDGNPGKHLLTKFQLVRVVYLAICNLFAVSAVFIGGIRNSLGMEMFCSLMGFLGAVQLSYNYIYRKTAEDIIDRIKTVRDKYQRDFDNEFQDDTRIPWKIVLIYFWAMTGIFFAYIVAPKIADAIYGIIWKDPIVIRVPLPLDSYLDKDQKRDLYYWMVSLVSVTWSALAICSNFGRDASLVLIGSYYSSLVKTFCNHLNIDTLEGSPNTAAQIKWIANQQEDLHLLSLKIRGQFGFPYALQNAVSSLCIVSLLYSLLALDSGGMLLFVAKVVNLFMMVGIMASTSFMGQHVSDKSEEIFQAIYNLPWYELRPIHRKYFITMLFAAREPFTIHFLGCAPLNFENFLAMMNTAYGYLMFLQSTL